MLKEFFMNTRKPQGLGGLFMLRMMNLGHSAMATWGFSHLQINPADTVLDIGCGGGKNIARMLQSASKGKVLGLDYSELSVKKSRALNQRGIAEGRIEIKQGSVSQIPYPDDQFDIVTAFETVYFWPDFLNDLKEVARVLKKKGTFLICNEETRLDGEPVSDKGFAKMLDLKIYSPGDFKKSLEQAGLENIKADISQKGKLLCVTAQKVN